MAGSKIKEVKITVPEDLSELQLRYAKTMAKILVDTVPLHQLKKLCDEIKKNIEQKL